MVIRGLLIALVCAGCLGKPAIPAQTSDGGTGDDGGVVIDSAPPADGIVQTTVCGDDTTLPTFPHFNGWPSGLILAPNAHVFDADHAGGDDLLVYGAAGGAGGAYVVYGRHLMPLTCFDQRYEVGADYDVIDAEIVDWNGDNLDDIVLFAKGASGYRIALYTGRSGAGNAPGFDKSVDIPFAGNPFDTGWGGTPGARTNAWITAVRVGVTSHALIFGGSQPTPGSYGIIDLDATSLHAEVLKRVQNNTVTDFPSDSPLESVWTYSPSPDRFVVATTDAYNAYQYAGTATVLDLVQGGVFDDVQLPRTVRTSRRLDAGRVASVRQTRLGTYDFFTYDGSTFTPKVLDGTSFDLMSGYAPRDEAFANNYTQENPPYLDLVTLTASATDVRLSVRWGIDASGMINYSTGSMVITPGGDFLAAGNFDGDSATGDTVLVLDRSFTSAIGTCYEPIHSPFGIQTCVH